MFGKVIDYLGGTYITGEDVGVTPEDIAEMHKNTNYVPFRNIPSHFLDPGPATAYGVIQAMETAARFKFWPIKLLNPRNVLTKSTVAIQGLGNVGFALMEMLHYKGVNVIVTDLNPELIDKAKNKFPNINVVKSNEIFDVECEIFSPCALGGILNPTTIKKLIKSTKIICGSANNQLENEYCDQLLHDENLLYCPDYLVNAGGVILLYKENSKVSTDFHIANFIDMIRDRLEECLNISKSNDEPTGYIAEKMAMRRL